MKFRFGAYLVLVLSGFLLAGCLGGGLGGGTTLSTNDVSGTLSVTGDLDDNAVLTVGLNHYVDDQAAMTPLLPLGTGQEGSYQITVPDGTYTLWVSGLGVTAVQVEVINDDVILADIELDRFDVRVLDTTFDSSTGDPALIDLWYSEDLSQADFTLLSSEFGNPVTVALVGNNVEVNAANVETDVYMFLLIEVGGGSYYYPVLFEDAAPII